MDKPQNLHLDCSQFTGRKRSICDGTSGLPPDTEAAYRSLWSGQPVKKQSLDCVYRGDFKDWIDCPTCENKTVRLKVYGCQLHSHCVMTGDVGKIKGCVTCGSRQSAEP